MCSPSAVTAIRAPRRVGWMRCSSRSCRAELGDDDKRDARYDEQAAEDSEYPATDPQRCPTRYVPMLSERGRAQPGGSLADLGHQPLIRLLPLPKFTPPGVDRTVVSWTASTATFATRPLTSVHGDSQTALSTPRSDEVKVMGLTLGDHARARSLASGTRGPERLTGLPRAWTLAVRQPGAVFEGNRESRGTINTIVTCRCADAGDELDRLGPLGARAQPVGG